MNAREHTLRLDCDLAQLSAARAWMRALLDADGAEAGDAVLVVTELATNAIRHARSSPTVAVTLAPNIIHIEVSDDSTSPPSVQSAPDTDGGFGLRLIDHVALQWGWRPTSRGKVVWTDLARVER